MQGNSFISEYFIQLKIFWDEMNTLHPIPSTLSKCDYGGLSLMRKYQNVDQVTQFSRGLSDSFSTIRSHIMMIQPLP